MAAWGWAAAAAAMGGWVGVWGKVFWSIPGSGGALACRVEEQEEKVEKKGEGRGRSEGVASETSRVGSCERGGGVIQELGNACDTMSHLKCVITNNAYAVQAASGALGVSFDAGTTWFTRSPAQPKIRSK